MQIVCPHCTTSYAVNPANFADAGRKVRCARCQEVWLARPEPIPAMIGNAPDDEAYGAAADRPVQSAWSESETPHVESPSISGDWPDPRETRSSNNSSARRLDSASAEDDLSDEETRPKSRFHTLGSPIKPLSMRWLAALPAINLNTACVAMGAAIFALTVWRTDVVRVMPQTAAFFKMVGLDVNLRGLAIKDVKITTETVNNKPVLLIEGAIIGVTRKPVEIPRLRFIVRDEKGADLYAWNAVLEQATLNPGDKAWFKTRLATPPAEGREIAVRFFHKLDIAAGGT